MRTKDEASHRPPPAGLAMRRLAAAMRHDPAALERFFRDHAFPLVEGPSVTFVYRGEADEVSLKHFIYGLPSTQPFRRLEGTDVWHLTVEVPERSRVEYKFEVVRGEERRWIEDPLNPQRARDPFGANSVLQAAGYEDPEWSRPHPETRPGSLHELMVPSRALGGLRHVTLYLPARYRATRRYPLLVVHDGGDYLQYSGLKVAFDNLIHRLEVEDLVAAFTHPVERLREYADDPRHAAFLSEELVPWLEREHALVGAPEGRCLMGASFGAVASLAAAWRYPGFYGRLLLQSGSFAFTDIGRHDRGPVFDPVVEFVNEFRNDPRAVSDKVFLSCGIYESVIYENRSLLPLLQGTGMEVRYTEARDGHNWENWRDRMREALSWLFPGPLWMVYE